MADVVLIFPRTRWDIVGVTTRLPLALLYIGGYLEKNGLSARIVDQRTEPTWERSLREALASSPSWVGITCMTGGQIRNGLAAARIVRDVDSSIPIVWGGVHPSILPEETLEHPLVDMVAIGEGEETALELSRALAGERGNAARSEEKLKLVKGIAFRRGSRVIRTEPRPHLDMNELPDLDYDAIPVESYVLREIAGDRSLQITSSRGCPHNCGYCYLGTVPRGRTYRAESAEKTASVIERLVDRYPINGIHIIDDEFFIRIERSRRVCELLLERGVRVRLRANCRIDALDRMDPETLRLIKRAGFDHLYLGVESGNDRVLEFIGKKIRREQVLRVNRELARAGIAPKYSFMAGFPTETLEEIKDTLNLMVRLTGENPDARTTPLQLYTPYPGTPLYDCCRDAGAVVPADLEGWSDWGWEQCQSNWLSPRERRFLDKAAYFTFFLDGKTVSDSLTSPPMRLLSRLYGRIVRARVARDTYGLMPEVALIRRRLSA
jgi:radical SAM superfamily enzyme YgiQ (UPF0313 family)